jgi:hypothetical protein
MKIAFFFFFLLLSSSVLARVTHRHVRQTAPVGVSAPTSGKGIKCGAAIGAEQLGDAPAVTSDINGLVNDDAIRNQSTHISTLNKTINKINLNKYKI